MRLKGEKEKERKMIKCEISEISKYDEIKILVFYKMLEKDNNIII
jgi:hypothetical protein